MMYSMDSTVATTRCNISMRRYKKNIKKNATVNTCTVAMANMGEKSIPKTRYNDFPQVSRNTMMMTSHACTNEDVFCNRCNVVTI